MKHEKLADVDACMHTDVKNSTYKMATPYRGRVKAEGRIYCIIYGLCLWPLLLRLATAAWNLGINNYINVKQSDVVTHPFFAASIFIIWKNLLASHAFDVNIFQYLSLGYFILNFVFHINIDVD